jgi:GNAT superfamily N-acetyltransferase
MLPEGQSLAGADLDQLAMLHCACLPGSLLTPLGRGAARSYYRYVAASPQELLLIERAGATIGGAAVLSLSPRTLSTRWLKRELLPAAFYFVNGCLWSSSVRRKVLSMFQKSDDYPAEVATLPEIVQVFVSDLLRNRKVGSKLLLDAESFLRQRGHAQYYLKTDASQGNEALHFYRRRGFVEAGRMNDSAGKSYVFFRKPLTHPAGKAAFERFE